MEIALVGATVIFHGATEIDQIRAAKALGPALLSRAPMRAIVRANFWRCMSPLLAPIDRDRLWAERGSSAPVIQTSILSAISRASSTSTPR